MLNFLIYDENSGLDTLLSENEEKLCFLQNFNENIQRNILLYNVLSDENFHTIVGNLSNYDASLEVLIYGNDLDLESAKMIADKITSINKPFYFLAYEKWYGIEFLSTYLVSRLLVLESSSVSVSNEDESVRVNLQCKPYVSQKITKKDKLFGLTRDGFKWAKYMESVMFKES
jgi:hypothetical protein